MPARRRGRGRLPKLRPYKRPSKYANTEEHIEGLAAMPQKPRYKYKAPSGSLKVNTKEAAHAEKLFNMKRRSRFRRPKHSGPGAGRVAVKSYQRKGRHVKHHFRGVRHYQRLYGGVKVRGG